MSIKKDLEIWLYKGCPCWVFNKTRIYFFNYFDEDGDAQFVSDMENFDQPAKQIYVKDDNIIPIIPPLEVVPDWATHIDIDKNYYFRFIKLDCEKICHMFPDKFTDWLPWHGCPNKFIGKTLKIPKWSIK